MSDQHPGPWRKYYIGGTHDGKWCMDDGENKRVLADVGENTLDYLIALRKRHDDLITSVEYVQTVLEAMGRHVGDILPIAVAPKAEILKLAIKNAKGEV